MSPERIDPSTYRVLLVDDNAAIHTDFRKILGSNAASSDPALSELEAAVFGEALAMQHAGRLSCNLESATQGQQGLEMVKTAIAEGRPYAVAFVDMRMPPGWDGLQTIEEIWKVDDEIQIVICSAYSDYDWVDVRARLGNSDRLLVLKKPAEPIEILQCMSALSRKWQNTRMLNRHIYGLEAAVGERTERLEAANQQLRYLASHDALTGLPNRVLLDDRLSQALAHAERGSHQFAVFVIDLDRFKPVNDSLGHRAGDELLKEVARRLGRELRDGDTLARLGGDELVVVTGVIDDRRNAEQIAARMLESLQPTMRLADVDVQTSASIGIACYPGDGVNAQMLLSHADAAMYAAKKSGGNSVQLYAAAMTSEIRERMQLETDLRQALDLGQFELHYQPKVDTATGEVNSAEAFIRWRHPHHGLLSAQQFVPLADDCGVIERMGEWVIFEACRQAKQWEREGFRPMRVAVNLSPSQFRLTNLPRQIRAALREVGLDASLLEVELTETALMGQPEESAEILRALNEIGVLVSVDDFGTGYSSMSYLRRFPIDKLKIDQTFIQEITTRAEDVSIVRAIVSLAHSLQLQVVAEGVETREQLHILKSLGCDQYQGFHYSPALPAREFLDFLSQRNTAGSAAHGDELARIRPRPTAQSR